MKEKSQISILTGIRFFAAFHVVLYHNLFLFGEEAIESIPSLIYSFIQKGEAAVSFFFILSGFILTYVYRDKLKTPKEKMLDSLDSILSTL